eukprot:TRINITY_DN2007_c0_g1_i2.p1 TRINITY_DN2007_c0_g1~~TRINITY_DN2007_c0_g1_i2.p1  ORF type:complete len:210 (-),score=28.69 TRINITY_DN2007_c0_g1_i2:65-694(-)
MKMMISPRIELTCFSSFFWLISILLSSVFWIAIPPLKDVPFWIIPWAVLFQEIFRIIFFKLYQKSQGSAKQTASLMSHPDEIQASLAFGWGSGVTQACISYVTILMNATGPAAAFVPSCPSVNLFAFGAFMALCWIFLHIFWSVLAYDAFKNRTWWLLGVVALSHLISAFLTTLNVHGGNCWAGLILNYLMMIILGIVSYILVSKRLRR